MAPDPTSVIAIVCAVVGAIWVVFQIGDRLWFKPKDNSEQAARSEQSARDTSVITSGIGSLMESQGRLLDSQAEMTRACSALLAETRGKTELDRMRHEEQIRMLTVIERQTSSMLIAKDSICVKQH